TNTLADSINGSLALYHSSRTSSHARLSPDELALPTPPDATHPQGRGSTGLLTLAYAPGFFEKADNTISTPITLSLYLGQGSADRASNPNRREDYVGETTAFALDTLFLSSFADPLIAGGNDWLRSGLANKRYAAFQYVDTRWSLLKLFADALQSGDDVESK